MKTNGAGSTTMMKSTTIAMTVKPYENLTISMQVPSTIGSHNLCGGVHRLRNPIKVSKPHATDKPATAHTSFRNQATAKTLW